MVKDNAFPLRSEQERVSNLTSSSQHYTGGSSQCKKAKKKKKRHTAWKEVKLSFADSMIIHCKSNGILENNAITVYPS